MTKLGSELTPEDQKHVLAAYVHRFTGDHRPKWAKGGYTIQFRDDQEWLAHTRFHVTKRGRLDGRFRACESSPTWPGGQPGKPTISEYPE